MENDFEKKFEAWATQVGKEAFLSINRDIDALIEEARAIVKNDDFSTILQGELLQIVSGVIEKEEGITHIRKEASFFNFEKTKSEQIIKLVESFIIRHLPAPPIVPSNIITPATNNYAALHQGLTQAVIAPPVSREYTPGIKKDITPPQQKTATLDPYREQVGK